MFRLQKLEITGFKSFADYTQLVFTDGITAVVGPNGCGKSNVADAISWVLGEQRAKQLRGGEMKDVIFQGSRNRQPGGMAEVVLHLVRDETTFEDHEIEEIDTTLEEIDEHADSYAGDATLAQAATSENSSATSESGQASNVENAADVSVAIEASLKESSGAHESKAKAEDATNAEAKANESGANEFASVKVRAAHAKRHWRPRRLALEFAPGETVSVARRLYRSGESEYLLNGRQCRLRDIQDLFSGTGLAGAHYAIIEQGRIGQILSAKPMDRRTLIEEAAGITKFRVRQRAAEARLEAARANLRRVSDIISEIERQVNSLRRQAAKARRYEQLRGELKELLRQVYAADARALAATLEELHAALVEAGEEEKALAESLAAREEDARRATAEAREREEGLAEARARVAEAALQRDRRERERAYQSEQLAALEKRLAQTQGEIEHVGERRRLVEQESVALREREAHLREENERTAARLTEAEAAYAERIAAVREAEREIEKKRAELLTHTAIAERLHEVGRQLESAIERLAQQAEGLEREGERAEAAHQNALREAEELQEETEAARKLLDELVAERERFVLEVAAARRAVEEAASESVRVRDEAARVRHRLDTLIELDAQRSLYSVAVQRLIGAESSKRNGANQSEIKTNGGADNHRKESPKGNGSSSSEDERDFVSVGALADFLHVEPRWERAVESVFGAHLQTVVVPTPDDALKASEWLERNEHGRAIFLVAGLQGAGADGFAAFDEAVAAASASTHDGLRVADLLGAPREIVSVLERTLERELSARVALNLEDAMERSLADGEMYVTEAGQWVAGGALVAAGDVKASGADGGAGLLAFKREMRELEARALTLSVEQEAAEKRLNESRQTLSSLEESLLFVNERLGRAEREHDARELNLKQLRQEIERAERHLRVVASDRERLNQERAELDARRAKQLMDAEAAEALRAAAQREVSEATERLDEARRAAEIESEHLSRERAAAAASIERRRATVAELRRMEHETGDLAARAERRAIELVELETGISELKRSLQSFDESEAEVEAERARLDASVEAASAQVAEAREAADALAQKLNELNRRAKESRERRASLEVRQAEAFARQNFLRESCQAELGAALEEIAEGFEPEENFDLEAARARVEEMRARLESFGAVNMMALEELAENETRFEFLTAQRKDITDGIISTEEALREIKRRSRERFREAFEVINRNFGELFQELFGGGKGEMSLIDAEDVLESGIDLVAQPPGKRLQNVLLLSGGEKAMAALALVLAIFRFRPSPFCLLDEVDAPLDEANIGRFTTKIVEMSQRTQFIVITHNKRTMEAARALYGVTMEEAGVSKLVSVKFE